MKKEASVIAFLFLASTATISMAAAPQRDLDAQTKAYIQDGLYSSSFGYELSTGLPRKDQTEAESSGESAKSFHYNTLSELDSTDSLPKVVIERLQDFSERQESFKASNSENLNKAYNQIMTGNQTPTKPKNDKMLLAMETAGIDVDKLANMPQAEANILKVFTAGIMTALTLTAQKRLEAILA